MVKLIASVRLKTSPIRFDLKSHFIPCWIIWKYRILKWVGLSGVGTQFTDSNGDKTVHKSLILWRNWDPKVRLSLVKCFSQRTFVIFIRNHASEQSTVKGFCLCHSVPSMEWIMSPRPAKTWAKSLGGALRNIWRACLFIPWNGLPISTTSPANGKSVKRSRDASWMFFYEIWNISGENHLSCMLPFFMLPRRRYFL